MTIHLRAFEFGDVDAVVAIEAAVSPDPWSASLFAGEFDAAAGPRHWLVACDGAQVVGFGGLMFADGDAHLMNLGVAPGYRRRGIARRLCAALFLDARSGGSGAVTLEVRASNDSAIGLYRRFAMVESGTRPRYYPDGEDAVIYWLHDLADPSVGARLEHLAGNVTGAGR